MMNDFAEVLEYHAITQMDKLQYRRPIQLSNV